MNPLPPRPIQLNALKASMRLLHPPPLPTVCAPRTTRGRRRKRGLDIIPKC
jgi:hypothetical protein